MVSRPLIRAYFLGGFWWPQETISPKLHIYTISFWNIGFLSGQKSENQSENLNAPPAVTCGRGCREDAFQGV